MPYGYGSANRGSRSSGPGPGGQGARGQATQNPGRGGGWSPGAGGKQHQPKKKTGGWSPGAGGKQHIPKKKTKTGGGGTTTTGGASPFAYTKTPKGRRTTTGGITGSDKFRKWIANNKLKTALYGTGALTAGAGYQTLSDINKINQWAKMGYGTGSPVPANMLSQLKGAWVPNKVFEKLGHGVGSTKGWLTGRVSPTHFGPVEAAMKAFKSPVGQLATKAIGPASVAYTAGDVLAQRSKAMGTEANRISALEGSAQTQAIEDYATKMYKPYANGGLIDFYRYGGFIG